MQFTLSGMSGVISHLASQAHTVAQNTCLITLAIYTLPLPFTNLFYAGINNEALFSFDPNVDCSPACHPFLIDKEIHGPAVNFAILKAANMTFIILAFVWASDLSRHHEL